MWDDCDKLNIFDCDKMHLLMVDGLTYHILHNRVVSVLVKFFQVLVEGVQASVHLLDVGRDDIFHRGSRVHDALFRLFGGRVPYRHLQVTNPFEGGVHEAQQRLSVERVMLHHLPKQGFVKVLSNPGVRSAGGVDLGGDSVTYFDVQLNNVVVVSVSNGIANHIVECFVKLFFELLFHMRRVVLYK